MDTLTTIDALTLAPVEAMQRRILREDFIRRKLDAANQAILAAMDEIVQTRRAAISRDIDNSPNPNGKNKQAFSDDLYSAYQSLRRAHAMAIDAADKLFPE